MSHTPIHITKYNGKFRVFINSTEDPRWLSWYKPKHILVSDQEGYGWYREKELPTGISTQMVEVTVFEFDTQEQAETQITKYLETKNIKALKTYEF